MAKRDTAEQNKLKRDDFTQCCRSHWREKNGLGSKEDEKSEERLQRGLVDSDIILMMC